jgi:hypothetical protein
MAEVYEQKNLAGSNPETIFEQLQNTQQAEREGRIDFSQFRNDSGESWTELYDEEMSLADNLKAMIGQSVILPSARIQTPIAVAYMMIPSAMANCVPNLFCVGQKGTGKSSIGYIAAGLHYGQIQGYVLGSSSTFASTRNFIRDIRFHDGDKSWERNCCLIWDDLKADTLRDEKFYAMIRSGYNRASDLVVIAGGEPGENIEFYTFSPKILSSIEPFYAQHKFSELARRVLVIRFKKFEDFTPEERREAELDSTFDIKDRFVPEVANWSGFETKLFKFWNDTTNLRHYQEIKKACTKRGKKSFTIPDSIEGENWTISIDLICAGVVAGVWNSLAEAVEHMGEYWTWFRENIQSSYGATQKVLKAFIEEQTKQIELANPHLIAQGVKPMALQINPELIKNHLNYAYQKGWTDTSTRPQDISAIMNSLGWQQELVGNQVYWVPMKA